LLRISVQDGSDGMTLKVEGKLIGPWISELTREWDSLMPFPRGKKLSLDLRGMTYVDRSGVEALRRIYGCTRAEILADTPMTQDFARKIRSTAARKKIEKEDQKEDQWES
jgi:hypothetical protein